MSRTKQNMLITVAVAGLLIAVLAMALPNLVLLPGQPFRLDTASLDFGANSGPFPGGDILYLFFRGMVAVMVVLWFIYIIFSLFSAAGRRRLLVQIILFAALLLVADYIQKNPPELAKDAQIQMPERPQMKPGEDSIPAAVFSPEPPQWLTLVIVLGGSLIVAFFAIIIASRFRRTDQLDAQPLEQLAEEAQNAIVSLHSGDGFKPTIIRCYQEMSRVLRQDRGIARDKTMTPREFEGLLIDKDLPQESVRNLTRLFERARYGHVTASEDDTDLAVACLTDIANACQTVSTAHG